MLTPTNAQGTASPAPRGSILRPWIGPVSAAFASLSVTAVAWAVWPALAAADIVLLYLLGIALVAHRFGRGSAMVAATASIAAYNFFFVPPYHTFRVSDTRHLITFAMMFGVGFAISSQADRRREQEALATARERRTAALYTLARALSAASTEEEVLAAVGSVNEEHPLPEDVDPDPAFIEAFQRQIDVALARARARAEAEAAQLTARTEQVRTALLSAVSHDLRTPLATIAGAASTLRAADAALSSAQRLDLAEAIEVEAARLERLVSHLLDMTRLAGGPRVVERGWYPVEEVVGSALRRVEPLLAGRAVSVEIAPGMPLLAVDAVLVEHALTNLLENATTHTPPATPVSVRAWVDGDEVVLAVADRGPGLPAGDPARLFDPFVRAAARGIAGSGLGLAICRGVAEVHEGSVHASNRAGGGAEFSLRLPVGEPPPLEPR
jgi:K+-sensing histidine kinase KdpD